MSRQACRASWFFVSFSILASCSTTPVAPQCSADADCGAGLVCTEGQCVAAAAQCTSGETRPCGPEPVGPCRRGTQACVDGAWATACTGGVAAIAETCNGVDDDCDGTVDEGVTQTFYVDADGDGFGSNAAGAETAQACTKPTGFSASSTDCDDSPGPGFAIKPSAAEVCDSANVDENCDGTANEGCGCPTPGQAQPCCAGRGTQRCEARDGGSALTECSVLPTTELCNGIDDDCDGQTDESFALDGGALPDGGSTELDGGCAVGLGACARSGATACTSALLVCSATAGMPTTDTCNGLDDNCDGQIDEASATLCPISGQACGASTCACPTGESVCGTSCQALGGACSVGTGGCARSGAVACTNGSATCNATAGQPTAEICNNLDDNCDGTVDEASATLCTVTGQSCAAGSCACPAGQSVCGTSCQTLGGACSTGVGACQRAGAIACLAGGAACNAVAGTPVGETCDGVDNDCDGVVDNGVTITCYSDPDGDRYATDASITQQCPDPSRVSFGFCPVGFVLPASSPDNDCAPTDPNLYRIAATRIDVDNDTSCTGTQANVCVGASAPTGRRFTSACAATDDCNDTNPAVFQNLNVRGDADNDTYCVGGTITQCSGGTALAGTRLASSCAGTDDCNDANAGLFTVRSVRADADGDGYCTGATFSQCGGATALAGTRVASSCQAVDDCKDNNFYATTACVLPGGYTTEYHYMACGIGLPGTTDTLVSVTAFCPTGFTLSNLRTEKIAGAGTCAAVSANILRQSCTGFDASNCRIVGDCSAN